jgi:hypothetical protein
MILEDRINGRHIGFDVDSICTVLRDFIEKKWVPQPGVYLKKALDGHAYAENLTSILSTAAPVKKEVLNEASDT